MIKILMTPAQYAAARAALRSHIEVRSYAEDANHITGSFSTSQVAMAYSYDGANLSLDVTAKYGMARFATESTIESKLRALLAQI